MEISEVNTSPNSSGPPWWFGLVMTGIWAVSILLGLLIVAITADSIAHAFAGKTTKVTAAFTASIVVNFVGLVALLGLFLRSRVHKRAATNAGIRIKSLERRLESLQGEQERLPIGEQHKSNKGRRLQT